MRIHFIGIDEAHAEVAYHNFEFLLSNVILGKIELLLPTPVLLLPEVAYCNSDI